VTALGDWLLADHREMEALLDRAAVELAGGGSAARSPAFEIFRARLLRHIAIEEKVLFAAARQARGGEPISRAHRLRTEHAALTSLLVPTPDPALIGELRLLLEPHDRIEEGPGGVYQECEAALGDRWPEVLERARAYPAVKVAAHFDGRGTVRTAHAALERASARR
jgi:hemerythrin HHE cation binding domain-containing protein